MSRYSRRPLPERLVARLEPIPKPNGGVRWLTRLDPAGEFRYREAVRPLAGRIERSLGPEVFAIRTRPAPGGWRLAPWRRAHAGWRRTVRAAIVDAAPDAAFAIADVLDCYGSITPRTVATVLGPGGDGVAGFLRLLHEEGVRGLPIGPEPSAIVANAVLAELGRAIRVAGAEHVRWVDDLVVWGPRDRVRGALDAVDRTAARLGLALSPSKTRVLADRDEARLALGGPDSSIIAAP